MRTEVARAPRVRGLAIAGAVALALLAAPAALGDYHLHMLLSAFIAIMLGFGHRLLLLTGQASYGHGGFYALGAYAVAILTATYSWNPWLALVPAILVPGAVALAIGVPVLRARGPYFFLISFGIAVVVNSLLSNLKGLTGGNAGIMGIPRLPGLETVTDYYFLLCAVVIVGGVAFWLIDRSRWTLELRAIGGSPDLASAIGISRQRNMVLAFVVGAAITGLLGGIFATYMAFVAPTAFSFWISVYILTFSMIGGAAYWSGPIVGATYVTLIPLLFNWSEHLVALFVAISIAVVMLLWPDGIVGQVDRLLARTRRGHGGVPPVRLKAETSAAKISAPVHKGGARLVVSGLNHSYGGIRTANNISFEAAPGEIVGIIGPNGAGKTTLFNLLSGYVRPQGGKIVLDGTEIQTLPPHRIEQLGLTRTFQASMVFDRLTVFENILLGVWGAGEKATIVEKLFRPRTRYERDIAKVEELIESFGLSEFAHTPAGSLPYGIRKLLGLAIGIATEPRVLCLDEPVAGLTDAEIDRMVETLRKVHRERQLTLLIVEHRMPVIMGLCDRVVVMNFGEVVAQGTPEQVQADPVVHEVYFAR
jgi:ABC-type branched-subunit amino acid transport system ATPase component/ABC-type branched-subunit amino acid transport system permease subunit